MGRSQASGPTLARWTAAGLLLVGLAVATALSGSTRYLRLCSPNAEGVYLCRPMGLTDAPVVAIFALVGLLLLPDLSRVKIGGVLELERLVAETNRNVQAADVKIERVLERVSAFASADSRSNAISTNSISLLLAPSLNLDGHAMARKAKEGLGVD